MSVDDARAFGSLLRRLRIAAGLTQQVLAEKAGISVDAVAALESSRRRRPRAETLRCLLDALGEEQPQGSAGGIPPRPLAVVGGVAAELIDRLGPELVPFAESMAPLGQHERVLCALPFALTVR